MSRSAAASCSAGAQGILSPLQREIVIDRLLALDTDEVDIERLKWVVLMVLSSQPGQEQAFARMEDLVFDEPDSLPQLMADNLVIVESPAKAKTIKKYLGKDFEVLASYGHVRDLVPKEGAVDPDKHFAMSTGRSSGTRNTSMPSRAR